MKSKSALTLAVAGLALATSVSLVGAQGTQFSDTATTTTAASAAPVVSRTRPTVVDTVTPSTTNQTATSFNTGTTVVQDTTLVASPVAVAEKKETLPVSGSLETTVMMMMAGLVMVSAGAFFALKNN